jgi:hypothetical protein
MRKIMERLGLNIDKGPKPNGNRTVVKVWKRLGSPTNLCLKSLWKIDTQSPILKSMLLTAEKRLECLEREFSELRAQVLGLRRSKKDWRSTVGTLEDDEITREAERLGREYREQQTHQKEIAGS